MSGQHCSARKIPYDAANQFDEIQVLRKKLPYPDIVTTPPTFS